jgi:hypothetical protein
LKEVACLVFQPGSVQDSDDVPKAQLLKDTIKRLWLKVSHPDMSEITAEMWSETIACGRSQN